MSDYIKREDAIVAVEKFGGRLNDEVLYEMKSALFTLPTADVVEVVRCKDCKWSEVKPYGCETDLICTSQDVWWALTGDTEGIDEIEVEENHYCSYGEREDGAEE